MKEKSGNQVVHSALALMKVCPSCSAKYANTSVNVISSGDRGSLVSMRCENCKLSILILITAMPFGLIGTGLPTDCTPEETARYLQTEDVTTDDVLEVHSLFEHV